MAISTNERKGGISFGTSHEHANIEHFTSFYDKAKYPHYAKTIFVAQHEVTCQLRVAVVERFLEMSAKPVRPTLKYTAVYCVPSQLRTCECQMQDITGNAFGERRTYKCPYCTVAEQLLLRIF